MVDMHYTAVSFIEVRVHLNIDGQTSIIVGYHDVVEPRELTMSFIAKRQIHDEIWPSHGRITYRGITTFNKKVDVELTFSSIVIEVDTWMRVRDGSSSV